MPEHVCILGDGAMATVCSILLTQGKHTVTMWGALVQNIERLLQNRENRRLLPGVRVPAGVRLTADDSRCLDGATMVLSAIPTQYLRSSWKRLAPYMRPSLPIVSVTKGIENDTLYRPTQVIADVLGNGRRIGDNPICDWSIAVLSGPNIAAEIARYKPATAVAASTDPALSRRVQEVFSTEWFRVYTNADVLGVELAAAVKNIIALAAGILDGLGAGCNAKAALVTRGLVEITRLGLAMGAQQATFAGLAGLGDLITTCISPEGRNRHVGEQIGKGRRLDDILGEMSSVAEGVGTTRAVVELAKRKGIEMPIAEAANQVLFEGKDPLQAISELMSREPKPERPS